MKRVLALLVLLCLLVASFALAEDTAGTQEVAAQGESLTVIRIKTSGQTDTLKYTVDSPKFESDDATLTEYLDKTITEPLMALKKTSPISSDSAAYTAESLDYIRVSFAATLDFPGILSLESTVVNRAADRTVNELLFFYRIIDLTQRRELSVYDLFTDPRETVDTALRAGVFAVEKAKGTPLVTDVSQVPAPNSYSISKKAFTCLFAAGTVEKDAVAVKIPWNQLALTQSDVLNGTATQPDAAEQPNTGTTTGNASESSTDNGAANADQTPVDAATLTDRLIVNDWETEGHSLRFAADGTIIDTTGAAPLFSSFAIQNGKLYLSSVERPDQGVSVSETNDGLTLTFDPETSDYTTLTLTVVATDMQPSESATKPVATPATVVATSTPMPVTGDDADLVAFLSQGLWKRIGTEGNTYYQFTPDGKLLTIEVSPYTMASGTLESDLASGEVTAGGSAFTVTLDDGTQIGYVLNRSATAIPGEEFVTPTPTPTPGPTPTPSPVPTPTATPSPTLAPTPTLSPYEQASQTAPTLAALDDASFAKRQTLKVYSAPDENSFRDPNAQVTTDDKVQIYGVTGNWVLVSYTIGNGSKGRIGYILNTTLADADNVAQLGFANIAVKLTKNAKATDDPLNSKTKLFDLKKDASVKLLGFIGADWAYVETEYKSKPCRAFIPRSSLIAE